MISRNWWYFRVEGNTGTKIRRISSWNIGPSVENVYHTSHPCPLDHKKICPRRVIENRTIPDTQAFWETLLGTQSKICHQKNWKKSLLQLEILKQPSLNPHLHKSNDIATGLLQGAFMLLLCFLSFLQDLYIAFIHRKPASLPCHDWNQCKVISLRTKSYPTVTGF